MKVYEKVVSVAVLLTIVGFASANEPNATAGLVRRGLVPAEFGQLSVEEKGDVLARVAESSYKILANVPEKGLSDSMNSLKQVVEARKWMEDTSDIVAWMLAFRLQYAVDSCILNELYRSEKLRLGQAVHVPFKKGSFDNALIMSSLKENQIDERKYLGFVLDLDTKIATFCRGKKYGPNDFLTSRVFREAAEEMYVTFELPMQSEGKVVGKETKQFDVRAMHSRFIFAPPSFTESRENATKLILPMVLNAIDDARDARLVARVYQKYGGFADALRPGSPIAQSKDFTSRVEKEFQNERKGRLTTHATAFAIRGTTRKRVECGEPPGYYIKRLRLDIVFYVKDVDIFPERFQKGATKHGFVGKRLDLLK